MKAAVLNQLGAAPKYQEINDPVPQNDDALLIDVKTASVKNIDKLRAGGTHYASYKTVPVVVGLDGVGTLEDGTRIYAQGLSGMLAEKALVPKNRLVVLPDGIDDTVAAALPNAVIGAAMALKFRAKMQMGHNVLINGATGVTGRLAVQIARYYGANSIVVSGRNKESLEKLKTLGADSILDLKQSDAELLAQLKQLNKENPFDIVIDYLWGHPIELIIRSLSGGGIDTFSHPVKIVTVGDMAGETIQLTSGSLRSASIELLGSGLGSFSQEELKRFNTEVLSEMFQLAANGQLHIDTRVEALENIEKAWNLELESGERLVITI